MDNETAVTTTGTAGSDPVIKTLPLDELKLRQRVEGELRTTLRLEYENLYEYWKQKDLLELQQKQDRVIQDKLTELWEKHQASLKPPSDEDIQKLLDQEYKTFNLSVTPYGSNPTPKLFIIRELPQAAEVRFYRLIRDRLIAKASDLAAITQSTIDRPFEEKLKAYLAMFDETPDILATNTVIVLNPFDEDKEITKEWVQKNISSVRQWQIVEAQIQVNRIRDFFSKVSQSGQMTQMMTGSLSSQLLQQNAL